MRRLSAFAAAALAFALTACGAAQTPPAADPGPTSQQQEQPVPEQPAQPEQPTAPVEATVETLAATLGCASLKPADKMLTATAGICTLPNGGTVEIATFVDNQTRDQYLELGKQAVPNAVFVKGDGWSAGGPDCTEKDLAPLA